MESRQSLAVQQWSRGRAYLSSNGVEAEPSCAAMESRQSLPEQQSSRGRAYLCSNGVEADNESAQTRLDTRPVVLDMLQGGLLQILHSKRTSLV